MQNPRLRYGVVALVLLAAEAYIATRLTYMNFVRGSLGDILVVVLLYAFALSIREFDRVRLAAGTFLFSCGIELCQYLHLGQRLGLRPNGILWVTLGSIATWEDIYCYFAGAILALVLDLAVLVRRPVTEA